MTDFPPLRTLLPHGPEMLLLDELVDAAADHVVCRLTLRPTSTFVRDGRVPCVVALEYMAQAVAAHFGLCAPRPGEPPRIGLLVGAREVSFAVDELCVGDALEVRAEVVVADDVRGSFECQVLRDGMQVAAATLSVYRGPMSVTEDS